MTAYGLGIEKKAFVNRGDEPLNSYYAVNEIKDIGSLPGLVGLYDRVPFPPPPRWRQHLPSAAIIAVGGRCGGGTFGRCCQRKHCLM